MDTGLVANPLQSQRPPKTTDLKPPAAATLVDSWQAGLIGSQSRSSCYQFYVC